MIYIKATNFISSKDFVIKRFDEPTLRRTIERVSEKNRICLQKSPLLASDWIPMSAWIEFFQSLLEETHSEEKLVEEAGEYNAERELTGVYKIFVRLLSPAFFLEKSSSFMERYFKKDEGKITVQIIKEGERKYSATATGFASEHYLFQLGVIGWMRKTLALGGAKEITIRVVESLKEGKERFTLNLSWLF